MSYPQYEKPYETKLKVGDKTITLKIGKFSEQTAAAVLASCGETVVHTTVALGNEVDWGYFPLHVEYIEKLYAGGIIKGSRWVKREGRPSDDAILKARIIDRSIRPLFPEGIKNQVQVVSTVFSYDQENDADMLALLASCVALSISPIPFAGPVAGLRVGYHQTDDRFVINPANGEREQSDLDLIVSGSEDSIVMVEAGANEASEELMVKALAEAQQELAQVCQQVAKVVKAVGKEKIELVTEPAADEAQALATLKKQLQTKYGQQIRQSVEKKAQLQDFDLDQLIEQIVTELDLAEEPTENKAGYQATAKDVKNLIKELQKQTARDMILKEGVRPDGRKPDEIRPIWCETDVFPRTHGSAMFKRGATQAVTITTLASPSLGQHIEDLEGEEVRHYMHHYYMPPYASGEAGRFGWPKRREVGHGALAERALLPMIPDQEEFPYTIRVVSEIMSSNGSTSQASVCGSTLSLMTAGVPIKKPVAGIAMGLMTDGQDKNIVLADIQGLEDHVGDMDFKVAGSEDGITALQMDIKVKGLSLEILKQALAKAHQGRMHILKKMLKCITEPRQQISEYAPKIAQVTIPVDKIGEVIGPGGKMIKGLIEQTGAEIDIDEDEERNLGIVNITSPDQAKIDHAAQLIKDMTREVAVGDQFEGTVTRVENYGAFVEFLPGREGLVHVSAMSTDYVDKAQDQVKLGDQVAVRIKEIKDDGKIGLTMLTQAEEQAQQERSQRGGSGRGRGGRNSRGSNKRRSSRHSKRGQRNTNQRGGRQKSGRSKRKFNSYLTKD
ncbi:MAG: polyribonucleotide nucleotidyltransferase [Candidatus Pacebacteria bacterium]|nr:polyribonucleotide nucleotidyltransferase [Candidatus Paceibacterota bacterium]